MAEVAVPRPPARAQARYLRRLMKDPTPVLDELSQQYGSVVALGWGPLAMVLVGDPGALREMFAAPSDSYRWGHPFNVLGFVVGDESMIVSDGDLHHRRRSSVQRAFARRQLNAWVPMIVDHTDATAARIVDSSTPGEPTDLYPHGRRHALGVVVRALFGDRMTDRVDEIGRLFERPQAYLESPALRQLPHPLPFTRRARVRADRKALDVLIGAEIEVRRQSPSGDPRDVLEVLVAAGDLTDAEICDQAVTLIGAGYDSTAASLAWTIWRAVTTPGLWEKLREEADEVLSEVAIGELDEGHLGRLDLADRVVRETLRLHPAGVFAPRQVARDVSVAGFRIPKGSMLLWSPYLAGRDAAAWTEPLRFDPDRFLDPAVPGNTAAWVPFGRGARNCIGFALAQMELTLTLSRLAQRLDVRPVTDRIPRPVGMVVNKPEGGVPMLISPRGA